MLALFRVPVMTTASARVLHVTGVWCFANFDWNLAKCLFKYITTACNSFCAWLLCQQPSTRDSINFYRWNLVISIILKLKTGNCRCVSVQLETFECARCMCVCVCETNIDDEGNVNQMIYGFHFRWMCRLRTSPGLNFSNLFPILLTHSDFSAFFLSGSFRIQTENLRLRIVRRFVGVNGRCCCHRH